MMAAGWIVRSMAASFKNADFIRRERRRAMAKNLDEACPCGSGKKYGKCCGKNELCSCGSGKKASECCYKAAAKSSC